MITLGSAAYWRATWALSLGSLLIFFNLYVTQPLLPLLAQRFSLSPLAASWAFNITPAAMACSLLCYGPLSDALGRRGIMLVTMSGVCLCTLALSQADSYPVLLALRALQGLLLGGLPAIAIAYMNDEFEQPALVTAVGLYIGANSLGGIGGRLIGGGLGGWLGWSDTLLVLGALSLALLAVFWRLLPPSRGFVAKPLAAKAMAAGLLGHLGRPVLLASYLIGGLNFMVFVNQYSMATFRLAEAPYGLPPSLLGLLFLTYLSGTLASTLSGPLARRWGQPGAMMAGIGLMMAGSLVTLAAPLALIVLGFLLSAFGFFLCHANASSWVSRQAQGAKASASSLYLVFYYLGASTGSLYLTPFWQGWGWPGVVAASLAVCLVTLALAARLREPAPVAVRA
ncbi:MFS transporter [Gallaecimonas sp. GXIMD4217]|uniref:MFS transporter n=1 Tax=Gallaecimonas sp. GXIMD4217 TaxID=3131927 RepID=UPI00311B34D2